VGVGVPVAVTVKVPAVPTIKLALFVLVMVGAVPLGVSPQPPGLQPITNNIKKTIIPNEKNLFLQQTVLFIVYLAFLEFHVFIL
jgi:hypothetical protein